MIFNKIGLDIHLVYSGIQYCCLLTKLIYTFMSTSWNPVLRPGIRMDHVSRKENLPAVDEYLQYTPQYMHSMRSQGLIPAPPSSPSYFSNPPLTFSKCGQTLCSLVQ